MGIQFLAYPAWFTQVGAVLATAFVLVKLGHKVLGLLRAFDEYRANRPKRGAEDS